MAHAVPPLQVHARNKPIDRSNDDALLRQIADLSIGYSGAELANLLNEAAILAVSFNHIQLHQPPGLPFACVLDKWRGFHPLGEAAIHAWAGLLLHPPPSVEGMLCSPRCSHSPPPAASRFAACPPRLAACRA